MGLGFVVFLFVGLTWLPNGGMERPIVQGEMTMAGCMADRATFLEALAEGNATASPAFHRGYGATPCILVTSIADGKRP